MINYATLIEYLEKKTERVILFFTEENDLEGLSFEIENNILQKYLSDYNYSQNLIQKQSQIDKYLIRIFDEAYIQEKNNYQKNKITEWSYFLKLYKLRSLTVDRINQTEIYQPNTYQLFERIVKKFKVYLKKKKYKILLSVFTNIFKS